MIIPRKTQIRYSHFLQAHRSTGNGATTGRWTLVEGYADVPGDITSISIRLDNNAAGTVWYDDVRIHPADAQMKTFTYDPLVGMTSSTDARNNTTYYQYDAFQRLQAILDQDRNVLKAYDYHYKP